MEEQILLQKAIEESKKEHVNPDAMSYEELLALSEKLGPVAKGFSKEEIEVIPSIRVNQFHNDLKTKSCPICCENFKNGDTAKKLNCKHEYHE
jgi:E3 ubiquitin-protein ligase RNF38/44